MFRQPGRNSAVQKNTLLRLAAGPGRPDGPVASEAVSEASAAGAEAPGKAGRGASGNSHHRGHIDGNVHICNPYSCRAGQESVACRSSHTAGWCLDS